MIYPKDLVPKIIKLWPKRKPNDFIWAPELPSNKVINEILECLYHTSFLTEESRKLKIRLLYVSFEELNKDASLPHNNPMRSIVKFSSSRPFIKSELLRLAPATDPEKMLICIHSTSDEEIYIWGIYDIGSSWWKFIHGEATGGLVPPNQLTFSSFNPGHIAISRQGRIFLELNEGKISQPIIGTFTNGPIGDFFKTSQTKFYSEICNELKIKKWGKNKFDDQYPYHRYLEFIERVIFNIRRLNHGGTLIIIPDKIKNSDIRLKDRISIKYPCEFFKVWDLLKKDLILHKRFYNIHFKFWKSPNPILVNNFQKYYFLNTERDYLEEAINDNVKLISSLSSVDGAVVMTDKFRLLGFGAEVIVHSPNLKQICVAKDSLGKSLHKIPIETFGTRHRSAFRFCSSLEDAIAIVISQDGGAKAIKRCEDELILWPDINEGDLGI